MVVVKLINGNLIVPIAANLPGVRGDGVAEIGPDDPSYVSWMNSIERSGHYIEKKKLTLGQLYFNAMSQARMEEDDDKLAILTELGDDYEKLLAYFAKEMEAIDIQYEKDLAMAERAKRILEEKRGPSKRIKLPPWNATPLAKTPKPQPKKGKKPKGK